MTMCVLLTTDKKYEDKYDHLLASILNEKPDVFLAHGPHSDDWEEAMDMLCVMRDIENIDPGAFCNTTSHPNETLEEVIEFAEQWCDLKEAERDIKILKI